MQKTHTPWHSFLPKFLVQYFYIFSPTGGFDFEFFFAKMHAGNLDYESFSKGAGWMEGNYFYADEKIWSNFITIFYIYI